MNKGMKKGMKKVGKIGILDHMDLTNMRIAYVVKIRIIWVYELCFNHLESH